MSVTAVFTQPAASRGERLHPHTTSRLHWVLTGIRVEMEAIIRKYLPPCPSAGLRLIDFGCGNMPYRSLFEPRVSEYIGCDLPGNEAADSLISEPDHLPLTDGTASIVLSSSVLEHVVDPAAYLAECHRVLSDDGLLILTTHGVWRYHPDPIDLWRWTSAGLRRQITSSGFSITSFRGILGPAATALQLWQDATLLRMPRVLQPWFTWCMQLGIRCADYRCSPEARDSDASVYVVVARKTPRV